MNSRSYQIIIGANSNSETRFQKDGKTLQTIQTANILSADEMRYFWVSWENGITFGSGRYRDKDVIFTNPDKSYGVKALAFCADEGNSEVEFNMYTDSGKDSYYGVDNGKDYKAHDIVLGHNSVMAVVLVTVLLAADKN